MNEMYAILGIGICLVLFLLVMLGIGSLAGGDWESVAQGVTPFIMLVLGFAFGAYVLWNLLGRR